MAGLAVADELCPVELARALREALRLGSWQRLAEGVARSWALGPELAAVVELVYAASRRRTMVKTMVEDLGLSRWRLGRLVEEAGCGFPLEALAARLHRRGTARGDEEKPA